MSDIILFPKLKENLSRQIRQAMKSNRYEDAYDLFMAIEKHFELSADEQLLKLECLSHSYLYHHKLEEESLYQASTARQPLIYYYFQLLFE